MCNIEIYYLSTKRLRNYLLLGAINLSKSTFNLQDNFLNQVRKSKMPVTIFLINGFKIKGVVKSFDNFTILMEVNGEQQMIYKHAVSTLIPTKKLNFFDNQDEESNQT